MSQTRTIHVDQTAKDRIAALRAKQGNDRLMLRITVEGGGCSGFQYDLKLSDKVDPAEDLVFADAVVTDAMSLDYLKDSEVRFEESLIGAEFKIDNPNATSSCGCGTSFSA